MKKEQTRLVSCPQQSEQDYWSLCWSQLDINHWLAGSEREGSGEMTGIRGHPDLWT